jgi:hypothetical protein
MTISLAPPSVDISDNNLSATITVSGTATGTVTLNTAALPAGVTATVSGTTITVTGTRPSGEGEYVDGSFTVIATRSTRTENFTVNVDLTTTYVVYTPITTVTGVQSVPNTPVPAAGASRTIRIDGTNHAPANTRIIALAPGNTNTANPNIGPVTPSLVGGFLEGNMTFPPNPTGTDRTYTIRVSVDGGNTWVTPQTTVTVLRTEHAVTTEHTVTFDPYGGERTGGGQLSQIIPTGGNAVLPTVSRAGYIFGGWLPVNAHQNVTAPRTITAQWTPMTISLSPPSVDISDDNLSATITVSGTATGTVTLNTDDLPDGVTATVSGTTITVTGTRPSGADEYIYGSFTVYATRSTRTEAFTVNVDLTTTYVFDSPHTGVQNITAAFAAMLASLMAAAVLWGYVLFKKA